MGDAWTLILDGWDPADEGRREALCTLGNRRFATRGSAPESVADGLQSRGSKRVGRLWSPIRRVERCEPTDRREHP